MISWCNKCQLDTEHDIECLVCRAFVEKYARVRAASSKRARIRRRAAGQCINGPNHDRPRKGECRCDWCKDVHRRGLDAVLANPKFKRPGVQP